MAIQDQTFVFQYLGGTGSADSEIQHRERTVIAGLLIVFLFKDQIIVHISCSTNLQCCGFKSRKIQITVFKTYHTEHHCNYLITYQFVILSDILTFASSIDL
jgi:hypothetical protein